MSRIPHFGFDSPTRGFEHLFTFRDGTARLLEGVPADDSGVSLSMTNTGATHSLATLSALGDGSATSLQINDGSGTARAIAGFGSQSGEIIQLNNANDQQTFRAPCSGPACP